MRQADLTPEDKLDIVLNRIAGCPVKILSDKYGTTYDTMIQWTNSRWYGKILQKLVDVAKEQPIEIWIDSTHNTKSPRQAVQV